MPVTPVKIIPDMRKSFEIEVKTTETTTLKKTMIIVDSRQDETRPSEIRPSQIAPPSEREGGDDWFLLFDIIREKPIVVPPGTFHCQRICICIAIKIRQLTELHLMCFHLHQTSKSSSKYKILNEFVSYLFTFTLYISCCG